jgi:hypothetical protein
LLFGLLFVVAPSSVAAFLADRSVAPYPLVVVLGVGLLINGLALYFTARADWPSRTAVRFFSFGDALWVLSTVVLIATGIWIDRLPGVVAALAVAGFVGTVGWIQWAATRRHS